MTEPAYDLPWASRPENESWNRARESIENGEVVALTADGKRIAEIVPIGMVDALEETVEILSDTEAVRALLDAHRSIEENDVVRGEEAVRALFENRE